MYSETLKRIENTAKRKNMKSITKRKSENYKAKVSCGVHIN